MINSDIDFSYVLSAVPEFNWNELKDLFIWNTPEPWHLEIEKQIIKEGSEQGPYSWHRTPYFKEITAQLDNKSINVIGLKLCSQLGKTRLLISIALEWMVRHGGQVYYYVPSVATAQSIFRSKIISTVQATPHLNKLLYRDRSGNLTRSTINYGESTLLFRNGSSLQVITSNSKMATKEKSAALIVCDELDECIRFQHSEQGDFISRLISRTASFGSQNRKVLVASTPTKSNFGIEKLWSESRQYKLECKCRGCEEYVSVDFKDLLWDKDPGQRPIDWKRAILNGTSQVKWVCPKCGTAHEEYKKQIITKSGIWVDQQNENGAQDKICYHLNALHSERTWKNCALTFIESEFDTEKKKEFRQQILAEMPVNHIISKIDKTTIFYSNFKKGNISNSIKIYTGIDVQTSERRQELYITTIGKLPKEQDKKQEYIIIDYSVEHFETWDEFPEMLKRIHYKTYAGKSNNYTAIDTGSRPDVMYSTIEDINRNNLETCFGIKGTGKNENESFRTERTKGDDYKPVMFSKFLTNDLLEEYILAGNILFPQDVEADYLRHIQNAIQVLVKNKPTYIQKTSISPVDWRDSLRYALALSRYLDKLENKQNFKGSWIGKL